MRRSLLQLALILGSTAPAARASGPADPILRLVPSDSGVTLAVEALRDHAREIGGSPLLAALQDLPAARAWLASDGSKALAKAARDVEAALRLPIGAIRDELVGDAVVLAFQPGPAGKPEQARGLLLALPRDRALADRLMAALNDAQIRSGELLGVEARARDKVRYSARNFRQADRPSEYYAQLEGGAFVWSNSEEMLLGVIDRKLSGGKGLGDDPAFLKVRKGLPERSVASLFVNPRLIERAMAEVPRPAKPADERVAAMLGRYLGAVEYAGASLQWGDGVFLHTHEAIDPARLDPWLRRWLTGPSEPLTLAGQVPESALAVVSVSIDPEAIGGALWELVPEADRPGLDNLRLALRGILMGRDPVTEILPRFGPGMLLTLGPGPRFPLVAALSWKDRPDDDLTAPLDNALRTALAFYALSPKRKATHHRVETRTIGQARVTELTDGLRPLLGYRVDRGRVVLGNVPGEVARFGVAPDPGLLGEVRAKYFPEAETFAVVDLGRLVREVRTIRGPIARRLAGRSGRPAEAVDGDLGQILALADLFRAATFSSAAGPDPNAIHRSIGLIAR